MTSRKKRISFVDWIEREGVKTVAKRLGVDPFTVLHWKAGRHEPRVEHMRQIKRLTGGEIGYERIIDRPPPTKKSEEL